MSRKNTRISNFDVRPPDGVELPGVGLGGLSTGVGLGGNPSQISGEHGAYGLNRPVGGNSNAGIYGNAVGPGLMVSHQPSQKTSNYEGQVLHAISHTLKSSSSNCRAVWVTLRNSSRRATHADCMWGASLQGQWRRT